MLFLPDVNQILKTDYEKKTPNVSLLWRSGGASNRPAYLTHSIAQSVRIKPNFQGSLWLSSMGMLK
jgi:hypothetical protein